LSNQPEPSPPPSSEDQIQPRASAAEQQIADKRRFPRVERAIALQYQVSHDGAWVQGEGQMEALDLSEGGVRIRISREMERGAALYLHVPLPDGPVFAMGTVIWTAREDNGEYTAGVAFNGLNDEDRERIAAHAPGAG